MSQNDLAATAAPSQTLTGIVNNPKEQDSLSSSDSFANPVTPSLKHH
jgi:hypothetical protein